MGERYARRRGRLGEKLLALPAARAPGGVAAWAGCPRRSRNASATTVGSQA